MLKAATAIGGAIIFGSLGVALFPENVVSFIDIESRGFIYFAAAARAGMGLVLILAASDSRFPNGLRVLGGLSVLGGLVLPWIPVHVLEEMFLLITTEPPFLLYGASTLGVLIGAFILYASLPARSS